LFYLLQLLVCRLHLTWGLALGWQDVVLPQQRFFNLAFVRGWTSIYQLFFVTFNQATLLGCGSGAGH